MDRPVRRPQPELGAAAVDRAVQRVLALQAARRHRQLALDGAVRVRRGEGVSVAASGAAGLEASGERGAVSGAGALPALFF